MRAGGERYRWQINCNDQFVVLQICIACGRVPRKAMKIRESNFAFSVLAAHAHDGIERCERDAHIARMRRDALFALTENRMNSVVTFKSAAAAAGLAFVASRKRRIVKIITARALQKIAAHSRHVTKLRTCAGEK